MAKYDALKQFLLLQKGSTVTLSLEDVAETEASTGTAP